MIYHSAHFQPHPYILPIEVISGVRFTPREIDILACILGRRTAKKIAFFLSISSKTVENHIRNIMQKLECNSRESIIEFIENCEEFQTLQKHYASLLIYGAFKENLHEVANLIGKKTSLKVISYLPQEQDLEALFHQLIKDLKETGIILNEISLVSAKDFDQSLLKDVEAGAADHLLYVLPESQSKKLFKCNILDKLKIDQLEQETAENQNLLLVLLSKKQQKALTLKNFFQLDSQNPEGQAEYFRRFFELLENLMPSINLQEVKDKFKRQCHMNLMILEIHHGKSESSPEISQITSPSFLSKAKSFLYKRRRKSLLVLSSLFLAICFSASLFFFITTKSTKNIGQPDEAITAHCDLTIPAESVFLDRPELIAEIEKKLEKQKGLRIAALVGPGGGGKTILARQYARQKSASIIWEIDAKTKGTLLSSLESLAYTLSKTAEDKKTIKEIQEIKNSNEREEKINLLIKEKLRSLNNWLLIYHNAENISNIQQYIPKDAKSWGEGRVILTTRDSNIQDNDWLEGVIYVGELTDDQQVDLFVKILSKDSPKSFSSFEKEEIRHFIQQIPSFPLDIAIAAHYVKETNTPYDEYIKYMNNPNFEFGNLQENVLKDITNYEKTRYQIIALSLDNIISAHKDFKELALFISLIGFQHIPRELLYTYKNKIVVDNFIYTLKRYSFIAMKSSESYSSVPTFSIHQSSQGIILDYLNKISQPNEIKKALQSLAHAFEKYTSEIISKEDILRIKLLVNHHKTFLSHDKLLPKPIIGSLESKLGSLYLNLGQDIKAKRYLEEGLLKIKSSPPKDYSTIAQTLVHLGSIYRELGSYKEAQDIFEESLTIYTGHLPHHYEGKALALRYLGGVYKNMGELIRAKEALEESYSLLKTNLSGTNLKTITTLLYLGRIYIKLGYIEKAKSLLDCHQDLDKTPLDEEEDNIEIARAFLYLGVLYRELGKAKKARPLLEKSLASYIRIFGGKNIRVGCILRHLGNAHKDLGNVEQAKSLLEKSLTVCREYYPDDHVDTARVLRDLGEAYFLAGDIEAAENYTHKALEAFQKNKHIESYTALINLSDIFLKKAEEAIKKGDSQQFNRLKTQAKAYLRQGLEIVKSHLPEDSAHIARIENKVRKLH